MTTDISGLVFTLRSMRNQTCDAAADALEAMAGEVERLKTDYGLLCDTLRDDRAERDRLKEALLDIKHFGTGFAQDRARKALGGDAS